MALRGICVHYSVRVLNGPFCFACRVKSTKKTVSIKEFSAYFSRFPFGTSMKGGLRFSTEIFSDGIFFSRSLKQPQQELM